MGSRFRFMVYSPMRLRQLRRPQVLTLLLTCPHEEYHILSHRNWSPVHRLQKLRSDRSSFNSFKIFKDSEMGSSPLAGDRTIPSLHPDLAIF